MNDAPPRPSNQRWLPLAAGLALVLAVVAAYWNSLGVPFQFDDEAAVPYNPTIRSLHDPGAVLNPPDTGAGVTGRPVVNLSLAINYAVGGLDVRGYHAVNLALHAAAALALWGVLRRTLRRVKATAADSEALAWCVTLLWTVHPLLTESVVCIVQRNEILGGLGCLLTLYGFIRASEENAARNGWRAFSVAACLAGVGSKEIVAAAPLLVWLYDRTFVAGSFGAAWRARRGYYLALTATWIPLGWLMLGSNQRAGTVGFGLGMSSWDYLLTQCRALTTYLQLSVWPHPLIVDYGMTVSRLGDVWWRGLIVLALLGATTWALVRRPAWGFVGAWFFLILAPSSSFVPLTTQVMAEHRMYLPLVPVMVAAGLLLHRAVGRRTVFVAAALGTVLAVATTQRNRVYQSGMTLWTDTVARVPGNPRAQMNLGQMLFKAGRIEEASERFAEALRLRPQMAEAHYNQGLAMTRLGRRDEAMACFHEALRLMPDYAVAHNDLGIAFAEAGRTAEAEREFAAAVRLRADFAGAHFNLANLLLRGHRTDEAIGHFEAAVRINPSVMDYRNNLAFALMRARRSREAVGHYETAVSLAPERAELRLNYALALAATGRLRDAVGQAEAAVRLKPDFAAAQDYLESMRADLRELEARRAR